MEEIQLHIKEEVLIESTVSHIFEKTLQQVSVPQYIEKGRKTRWDIVYYPPQKRKRRTPVHDLSQMPIWSETTK